MCLQYVGLMVEIVEKMRRFSRKGRTFIFKQGGLPGFLLVHHQTIMPILYELQLKNDPVEEVSKRFGHTLEEISGALAPLPSDEERKTYLNENAPYLFSHCLTVMKKKEEWGQFLQFCKDNYNFYTVYIVEALEPYFEQLNGQEGKNFKHHLTLVTDRGEENHYW